jgi:hypothetical protein
MGNYFFINEYHQRSGPLMENPDYRILMIGDSVTNEGVWTNQNETITEILEKKLNDYYSVKGEVLNAAAESWGIENEFEYVKKFGIFNADLAILQIGSQDLVQPKSLSNSLGTLEKPTTNPICAIHEALQLKFPNFFRHEENNNNWNNTNISAAFNWLTNLYTLKTMAELIQRNTSLIVLFTPYTEELSENIGFNRIRELYVIWALEPQTICHIDLLQERYALRDEHFRDSIHFNEAGDELLAEIISKHIIENKILE